jgi:hypothetical protein
LEPSIPYAVVELSSFEDLLQSVKTLEDSLQDLPSIDNTLADIERFKEGPEGVSQ